MDWTVDIAVEINDFDEWEKVNDIMHGINSDSASAGTGFGYRDMQWIVDTEKEARTLSKKLEKAITKAGFKISHLDYYPNEELHSLVVWEEE